MRPDPADLHKSCMPAAKLHGMDESAGCVARSLSAARELFARRALGKRGGWGLVLLHWRPVRSPPHHQTWVCLARWPDPASAPAMGPRQPWTDRRQPWVRRQPWYRRQPWHRCRPCIGASHGAIHDSAPTRDVVRLLRNMATVLDPPENDAEIPIQMISSPGFGSASPPISSIVSVDL